LNSFLFYIVYVGNVDIFTGENSIPVLI